MQTSKDDLEQLLKTPVLRQEVSLLCSTDFVLSVSSSCLHKVKAFKVNIAFGSLFLFKQ